MLDRGEILIVDDEPVILAAATRILEREGLSVRTAPDAETALDLVKDDAPDVVVIDLKLPGMSGLDFLARHRETGDRPLIILMTGYATAAYAVSSLLGGAFDYLPKPFAFQELLSPVRRALRYLQIDPAARTAVPVRNEGRYYRLGEVSWAYREDDGHFLLGPTSIFLKTVGKISEVAMPSGHELVHQGGPLAKVSGRDGYVHNLWVPLSGRVLALNSQILEYPQRVDPEQPQKAWIARIAATDPVSEMKVLMPVH